MHDGRFPFFRTTALFVDFRVTGGIFGETPAKGESTVETKDLWIIGAGTAGLSAAVYAARAGADFGLLERDGFGGGQITSSHWVENYPGLLPLTGMAFAEQLKAQAVSLGATVTLGNAVRVEAKEKRLEIRLEKGNVLSARVVIAATGSLPRKLGVPGEEKLVGHGVSYCALCDGAFYAGKKVAVVGGGDAAIEDAHALASRCASVTLIHRREEFRGAKKRLELLTSLPNVFIRRSTRVTAVHGETSLTGVTLECGTGEAKRTEELAIDGLFIAVGTVPEGGFLDGLPLPREDGYVLADETCATPIPGLFVAGDLRRKPLRQLVTAAADGANAAQSALDYLQTL